MHTKEKYFNRELSWLAFNTRVLNLCEEKTFPLLERMRFLSITSSNLDEFYEVRVAGLLQRMESKKDASRSDYSSPTELLKKISETSRRMLKEKFSIWHKKILPELNSKNIFFKSPENCTNTEKKHLKKYFQEAIYPYLTSFAIDEKNPFLHLQNKSLYLLVQIAKDKTQSSLSAIISIPANLDQIVRIENTYIFLEEIIKYFAHTLFKEYKIQNASIFRVTRNSELYLDEEADNLLNSIESSLHKRRQGAAVRLEVEDSIKDNQLALLTNALALREDFIFKIQNSPLNMTSLFDAYQKIDCPDLKFLTHKKFIPKEFENCKNIFEVIAMKDKLLHHPYESFEPIEKFIEQAAQDDNVLSIKITLYRIGTSSAIIESLKKASQCGKKVTALIELRARFDEEKNIEYSRQLKDAKVEVIHGISKLKTHCKTCLITRKEGGEIKHYAHLGTGNYNSKTSKIYTDISLLTCDKQICEDIDSLFNFLTKKTKTPEFNQLLVSPFSLGKIILEKINQETKNAKAGKKTQIIIKANSIIEKEIIDALYSASQAGVKINLIIRGICGLIPQDKILSKNIKVISIVGTYLEHSRIYYFHNDGDPSLYAGSADLMNRNIFRRVEIIFPIRNKEIKARITNQILGNLLKSNLFADVLNSDGSYFKIKCKDVKKNFSAQEFFAKLTTK